MKLNIKIEGQGEPVVFLHPVGLDLTCWDAIAAELRGRYRLLRIDLRGHGASPPAEAGMDLAGFAADVHDTLAWHCVTPAAVVGLSFGGMVAQALTLDYPADVSRLVVAACPCMLPDAARPVLFTRGKAAREHGMQAIIPETLERWFTPAFIAAGGADAIRDRLLRTEPAAWDVAWQAISRINTAPRLHEIAVPALCIAGALDPASPPAAVAEIARRIPHARLLVLEGAPHIMQVECPDLLAQALDTFLCGQDIGERAA